jgi:NADPH:quinone reductase-like Zn-dependent oxidoreductase
MGYRPGRRDLDLLTRLFEEKKVIPVIDKIYSLEETVEAFRYFGKGMVKGKVVIQIA